MGHQVRFFMAKQDEREFLSMVTDNQGDIVDDELSLLEMKTLIHSDTSELSQIYLTFPDSRLIRSKSGGIDIFQSDVIEFSRCYTKCNRCIQEGRIWAEFRNYGPGRQIIIKDSAFIEFYDRCAKWIKKHYRISRNKLWYIGPEAYRLNKKEGYQMLAGCKNVLRAEGGILVDFD